MGSPILPDVVRQLKNVADPSLSADGSRLAFTLSWVDPERLESRSRIMLLRLATGETAEFTQGLRDSFPKFSPDGTAIAFLRGDEAGKKNIWLIPASGGEAHALTTEPEGVVDLAWSPDSRKLAYVADVNPDAGQTNGTANPNGSTEAMPQVSVVRRIRYRYDTLGWRGDAHFHLFVTDLDGADRRQLTDGDWDDLLPTWSPDGSRLAFVSGRGEDRDTSSRNEAYVIPASGGEPQMWSQGLGSVGALTWSPDGQQLLAVGSESPDGMALWQGWLYKLAPGQKPQRLTDDSLRPYLGFPPVSHPPEWRWTEDGRIVFLGESRGESFLYQVSAEGGQAQRLSPGGWLNAALALDPTARIAVTLAASPTSPGDLHYLDTVTQTGEQLTHYNRDYLERHPPAQMEKFSLNRAGTEIECRLFKPADFDAGRTAGRKYPLILDIHGGPNGAFYDSFVAWQQVLATAGYLVLAVNPRGSSTYGNDFMTAVLEDWGGEDYLDLMAAVDEVIARDYVDETRLGVHGYSYGGYMTSWMVGHTPRFKAAVVGAPCINLVSMYGTSDIGVSFGEVQWGGSPVDAHAELVKRSPLTYADQVETPVLLLHGEADARCPISQSEEYFVQLKRLGKEVEMVRFPGCSHLFVRLGHPKMREEYLARTLDWFNKYLC